MSPNCVRGSVARDVLEALRARLYVDDAHNARCIQGCLSCVLSYGAQHLVGVGLDRPRGLALLDALLSGGASYHAGAQPRAGRWGPDAAR